MTFSLILFYVLAAIVLFGALKTVTAKNPVHASLYLVLTFCVSAMIWMLMQAEFLGITLVLVYVGAVKLTLESAVEFIDDDELVEITPQSIRLRKRWLQEHERRKHFKKLD